MANTGPPILWKSIILCSPFVLSLEGPLWQYDKKIPVALYCVGRNLILGKVRGISDWLHWVSYCFLSFSLWCFFILGVLLLPYMCQSWESKLHPETTQLVSANCTQWLLRICRQDEGIVSCFKNREIFVLDTFSAYIFPKSVAGVSKGHRFWFSGLWFPAKYYFMQTNVHVVFYCHLWLHSFGLAGQLRVNKWSTTSIFANITSFHEYLEESGQVLLA